MVEIDLTARYLMSSGFHVGAASPVSAAIDRATLRWRATGQGLGFPYLPGTSLKGKLRNECERILGAIAPGSCCITGDPESMCPHARTTEAPEGYCPVCRIFGGNGRQAPLVFGDALPEPDVRQLLSRVPYFRAGIGINRKTGSVLEQRLFFTEIAPAGLELSQRVSGLLPELRHVALLAAGYRTLFAVGGNKSRGSGWCRVELKLTVDGCETAVDDLMGRLDEWKKH